MSQSHPTPEVRETAAFRIVGPGDEFSHAQMHKVVDLWAAFARQAGEIPGADPSQGAFGAMTGKPEQFLYVAGLASTGEVPDDMREIQVPAGNYAIFTVQAPPDTDDFPKWMGEQFNLLWRQWMPASGLKMRFPAPVLERYGEKFDAQAMTGAVELWVPVA